LAGVVDEDLAHRHPGHREEVSPVREGSRLTSRELEMSFVHQGIRVERVRGAAAKLAPRDALQLSVDDLQYSVECLALAQAGACQ
jgi:hypothetical protein